MKKIGIIFLTLSLLSPSFAFADILDQYQTKESADSGFKKAIDSYSICYAKKSFTKDGLDTIAVINCDIAGIQNLTRFIKSVRATQRSSNESLWREINERHQVQVNQCSINLKDVYFRNSGKLIKSCEFSSYASLAQAAIELHY